MLVAYGVWAHFFDRRGHARHRRIESIRSEVQAGVAKETGRKRALGEHELEILLHERSAAFRNLEALIQRARSRLTAGKLLLLMLALFLSVLLLGLMRGSGPLPLLAASTATGALPLLWLRRRAERRLALFSAKLPEALDYVTRALHAGHSLTSAIGMVGREFPNPIGEEFKTVFDEIGFGIPFREAITELGLRIPSSDVRFFVISLVIQHETGGNLTELLEGLSGTIRERIKLRGKVRTLSSEGRASGWVLGSMPFALAAILMLINPGYVSLLWTTEQGRTLLLIGGGLMSVGFFLLNRIVQIKV
ncbi:type II secretion system F family protein [Chlorobium sp. N1]|nr:type II secretion system F family protein [Chlorobium sp. N1]